MYCSGTSRRRRVENSIKSILNKYSLTPGLHWEIKLLNISDILMWRRPPSKNKTKVLKISIIEGKYLGFRYLPLIFCVYSARSPSRPRCQKWVKCFPISLYVFPKSYEPVPKNNECFLKNPCCFPKTMPCFPKNKGIFNYSNKHKY